MEMDKTLLKASGYVYHSGKRTVAEFVKLFGFTPTAPYFHIGRNGLVACTSLFRVECDRHFDRVRSNWRNGIGVNA
jgi:hypothetical protein